jgi:uncharacterized protein (DUF849 family)
MAIVSIRSVLAVGVLLALASERAQMAVMAWLNGGRTGAEHPAVPRSPAELASDAIAVQRAGAFAVHVHLRDPSGMQTLDARRVTPPLVSRMCVLPDGQVSANNAKLIAAAAELIAPAV